MPILAKARKAKQVNPSKKEILIASYPDVIVACQVGGQLADRAGLSKTQKYCLLTSISELATNILRHANRGSISLKIIYQPSGDRGIEVVASDNGPGIFDIQLAMQDDFSTTDSLGCGLPSVNRLMSQMELSSILGKGTFIRALKWASGV